MGGSLQSFTESAILFLSVYRKVGGHQDPGGNREKRL